MTSQLIALPHTYTYHTYTHHTPHTHTHHNTHIHTYVHTHTLHTTHTHTHTHTTHTHNTHTHRSSYNNTKWLHERSDRGGTHRCRCISWWPPNLWHPQPQTNQDYHPNSKNDDTGRPSVCPSVCLYVHMSVHLSVCISIPHVILSINQSVYPFNPSVHLCST